MGKDASGPDRTPGEITLVVPGGTPLGVLSRSRVRSLDMTVLFLTVAGLIVGGMLSGAFQALGVAVRRRQRGQTMRQGHPDPWRPAPRAQRASRFR